MLQIKNLNITHRQDLRVILEDFNCTLNDGDKAVIIGEEGNGKSTLLKWLCRPETIEGYCEAEGELVLNGGRLGYLPQELPPADRGLTLAEFFAAEKALAERSPRVLGRLAASFHLPPGFYRGGQKLGTLSGGERVKAQMLRLLVAEPDILLLDEPSNDIDIETLEWLEKLIAGWPGIALFVSHDETLIERAANMIIHIEHVCRKTKCRYTVTRLPYAEYLEARARVFEKQRQQAANDRREKRIRDEKYRRIFQSVERAQNAVSRQDPAGARRLKTKMHAVKSLGRRLEREDGSLTARPDEEAAILFSLGQGTEAIPPRKAVLDFALDELRAPGGRLLAKGLGLKMQGPEKIGLTGENGAGKTTLLREIAGEFQGQPGLRAEYMPQDYEEALDLAARPVDYLDRSGDRDGRTRIQTCLGSLKFTADEMARPIAELSGGQKAKLFLLKMGLSGANVLLLDEPTRNFSPMSGAVIRRILREFPGAIISVSHDRKFLAEVCDKIYRLTPTGLVPMEARHANFRL